MDRTDLPPLATRQELPDALTVLLHEFPRLRWAEHPNFGRLADFWMQRHGMFRQLCGVLEQDVIALQDKQMGFDAYAPRLSRFAGMLLNELHGHHQIEDVHYFPKLSQLDPRLERGFDLLDADHHSMDSLLHAMATGANGVLQGGEPGPFADQLADFRRMLFRHLEDEEDLIVPVMLKTGFSG